MCRVPCGTEGAVRRSSSSSPGHRGPSERTDACEVASDSNKISSGRGGEVLCCGRHSLGKGQDGSVERGESPLPKAWSVGLMMTAMRRKGLGTLFGAVGRPWESWTGY